MTLGSLDFGVSEATQKTVENELKAQTIQKFTDEAKTISTAFGASDYRIIKVDLNNAGGRFIVSPMMGYAVAEAKDNSATIQSYEGGESRLNYEAQGVIELVK